MKMTLTPGGTGHLKSLHIAVECRGMIISRIFIDNGPTLNVRFAMTLSMTNIKDSMILQKEDGACFCRHQNVSLRRIDLKILIGPCKFEVSFVVVDILEVSNPLFGCPWIHIVGAIPSSLHQKVKFI